MVMPVWRPSTVDQPKPEDAEALDGVELRTQRNDVLLDQRQIGASESIGIGAEIVPHAVPAH